ncbi:MAG: glycosyltransferase family 2 protein [Bacteroidota bacterium]
MEHDAILTVCIPAYNASKYIGETINSIIVQKTNFRFNVFISDDCSTDNTAQICESYKNNFPNIEIYRQPQNLGMSKNQHFVITHPKTKYIAYLDSDDLFATEDYLQKQFDFLESHPEVVVVFTNTEVFSEAGFIKNWHNENSKPPFIFDLHTFLQNVISITNSSMVFRSGTCNNIPDFFIDYFQYDWLLHIYHGLHGLFGYNDFIGTRYRVHENNATNLKNAEKKFKDGITLVYNMKSFLPDEYHHYFGHPYYEINSLAYFHLHNKHFFKFLYWYYRWLKVIPLKNINLRDEFYKFRKNLFSKASGL